MLKKIQTVALLLISAHVHADLTIPGIAMQQNANSALASTDKTLAKTGLAFNEDDITSEQDMQALKLNETQLHEARVWGLTEEEEKRYVFLMQNRSSIYYEGLKLTPIDILGINAKSEAERTHFAERSALQEAQKVAKNIAWNNAFYKAYNQLFAGVPVVDAGFDPSPFSPMAYKPITLDVGDTLFLFIKPDDAIKTVLLALMDAINATPNTHLNIMLLKTDDFGIQQWANLNQIPRELVTSAQIGLYHGDLQFENLKTDKKSAPLLLLTRKGSSSLVDLGVF